MNIKTLNNADLYKLGYSLLKQQREVENNIKIVEQEMAARAKPATNGVDTEEVVKKELNGKASSDKVTNGVGV